MVSVQVTYVLAILFGFFSFFSSVHLFHIQTMQFFLSITCIYLGTGIFIKGRRSNDYRNDWEGFDSYFWGDRLLLLAAFKPDRDCWASHDRRYYFFFSWLFLLPFDCSLFSFCTERADTFFKAVNRRIQYTFWYSQFFLSSACTGAALSLISQPIRPASAAEDETSLRHSLFLSHFNFYL